MNERIRELAEQAGLVFWELSGDVDWRQADKETLANFAGLIVRECDQYVAKHWDEMEPWMNPGDLLTHFGIEDVD
jgi:hypothetical protein